jgi:hypothetical protein
MVSNGLVLNASSYKNLFTGGTGALYVPVNPSAVIYAQFDHVRGIAAGSGQNGVSVNRVKILNTLIDQLVSMKSKPAISKEAVSSLTNKQMDTLIKMYQQQIKTSVAQASKPGTYGLAGLLPETGTVINIKA